MGVTDHGKHESPYKLVSWLKCFTKTIKQKHCSKTFLLWVELNTSKPGKDWINAAILLYEWRGGVC